MFKKIFMSQIFLEVMQWGQIFFLQVDFGVFQL